MKKSHDKKELVVAEEPMPYSLRPLFNYFTETARKERKKMLRSQVKKYGNCKL